MNNRLFLYIRDNKIAFVEEILYLIGGIFLSMFDFKYILFIAFIYTLFVELIKYKKNKDDFCICKLLIMSIIIPNNYIIISLLALLTIYYAIKNKQRNYKITIAFILFFLLNIVINKVRIINMLFALLYISGAFFSYYVIKKLENELNNNEKIVDLIKKIIVLETITIIVCFISKYNEIIGSIANDWIVGTFGFHQGNIFLFFMLFSILLLKQHYSKTNSKRDLLYIGTSIVLSILTNSVALTLMFITSFLLVSFFEGSKKGKIITLIVGSFVVCLFVLLTPVWIKKYIVNLTKPDYFIEHIVKVQTYKDTFYSIPSHDKKFLIVGNGMGQYSSRAALTCTGKYVTSYSKFFPISISKYTDKYILSNYIKYNINANEGTMYSPFSTIISMQGEYGMIGLLLFITMIVFFFKKTNQNSKIFILFFLLSCFIENYLEFAKVVLLLVMMIYMNKKCKNSSYPNNKRKRVAFCINSMSKGGAERVVSILANAFSKTMEVTIISVTSNSIDYKLNKEIKYIELSSQKNNIKNKVINKIMLPYKIISRVIKLQKIIERNKYDIIISFLPEASFITLMANRGTKIILSDRNDPNIEYKNSIYKFLMKKYFPKADGFVFQTQEAKNYFNNIIDFDNKKVDIILNPLNDTFFNHYVCKKRKNVIVNIGRITEQKNQRMLIEAFNIIKEKYPNLILHIYGDGELKDNLKKMVRDYKLEKRVIFKGIVDDIPNDIYNSKLFILTSDYEGMPNSLIEAMALGIPCISTDCPCGGPKMIIDNHKNGILTPVGDCEKLVHNIMYMLDNEDIAEKYGKEASKLKKKVTKNRIIKQWEKLIDDIIKGE